MNAMSTVLGLIVLVALGAYGLLCVWIEGRRHKRRSDEGHEAVMRALQRARETDLANSAVRTATAQRISEAQRLRAAEEVDDGR